MGVVLMSERADTVKLAQRLLDEPNADPDLDMIHANRDEILRKHEEAIQLIRSACCNHGKLAFPNSDRTLAVIYIREVIDALSMFHPMHEWQGWPKEDK